MATAQDDESNPVQAQIAFGYKEDDESNTIQVYITSDGISMIDADESLDRVWENPTVESIESAKIFIELLQNKNKNATLFLPNQFEK